MLRTQKKYPLLTLARQKYPRPSVDELEAALEQEGAVGFLVARNPYERLISAYRDKILGAFPGSVHEKLARSILIKYRGVSPKIFKQRRAMVRAGGRLLITGQHHLQPTFSEFVQFVTDEWEAGKELDMHWTPVYSFCNPCQVQLTHVIKFETFARDSNAIIHQAGIDKYLDPQERTIKHENASKRGMGRTTSSYLDELTPELNEKLKKMYLYDFEMFGYPMHQ